MTYDNIRKYLLSLSPEDIEANNKKQLEENKKMFKDFENAYKVSCCAMCGNKLNYFNEHETCFHWFTIPDQIRKKHLLEYLQNPIGYFKLESYFRWMATLDAPFKNINDLECEKPSSKLKELTIKYKNIEWSLNYGESDLKGHSDSLQGNFPHFHLQILIDNRPFIRFNDCHIPFSKDDILTINTLNDNVGLIVGTHSQGLGMSIIENPENLKILDETLIYTKDETSAPFNASTLVIMRNGEYIAEERFQQILKEREETKIPLRKLIKKYYPNASLITDITAGDSVPQIKGRKKR